MRTPARTATRAGSGRRGWTRRGGRRRSRTAASALPLTWAPRDRGLSRRPTMPTAHCWGSESGSWPWFPPRPRTPDSEIRAAHRAFPRPRRATLMRGGYAGVRCWRPIPRDGFAPVRRIHPEGWIGPWLDPPTLGRRVSGQAAGQEAHPLTPSDAWWASARETLCEPRDSFLVRDAEEVRRALLEGRVHVRSSRWTPAASLTSHRCW